MTGLLNPPVEAAVCQQMIRVVKSRLATQERTLTTTIMSIEQYMRTFGQAEALRGILAELEQTYAKNFNV